jgi:hypothetical protein
MNCMHCQSSNTRLNGVRSGKQRIRCNDCGRSSNMGVVKDLPIDQTSVEYGAGSIRRYVITACQNNAEVHIDFLKTLRSYCDINNAELLVVPILYRPTDYEFIEYNIPDEIKYTFVNEKKQLHNEVFVMGKFNFLPTTVNPLAGLESLSKGATLIVPSPQLRMKSSAVSANRHPAILHTTGAISKPEYANTKVGEKARFNHSYSAVLIEVDIDNDFHIRTLVADNVEGSFIDLGVEYNKFGSSEFVGSVALVTGDEHAIFGSPEVELATYTAPDSMVNVLKPTFVVRHDVLDMYSGSHHHKNDSIKSVGKYYFGLNSVQDELLLTTEYLKRTSGEFFSIIVPSNHNDHLTKWLTTVNIKDEPWNALLYHKMMYEVLSTLKKTETGISHTDPFSIFCKMQGVENIKFLSPGESFRVADVELGAHGHEGKNGSRGSINQYSDLSSKYVIGHSHTPGIISGAYQVGTSSKLNLEYVSGPSSWINCHCFVYKNGKRQLINIINGKYRA